MRGLPRLDGHLGFFFHPDAGGRSGRGQCALCGHILSGSPPAAGGFCKFKHVVLFGRRSDLAASCSCCCTFVVATRQRRGVGQ